MSASKKLYKRFMCKKNTLCNLVWLIVLATGCSTIEVPTSYYSVNTVSPQPVLSPLIQNNSITKATPLKYVLLHNIGMADFLKTGSIVMQINEQQLQLSNHHFWADKLPRAISVNLARQLSISNKNLVVSNKGYKNKPTQLYVIDLYFEQFTITHNNETVVSGSYSVHSKHNEQSKKIFFDIRQPLTKDGYNHAIEAFKQSLTELSALLIKDI